MRNRTAGDWLTMVSARARREGRELSSEVLDELASHLADLHEAALARGHDEDEADRIVVEALDRASLAEVSRRARARARVIEVPPVLRYVRDALRQLRRSPGFTATALITLAIGIGANTAVFTLVHAVLLKSLPVAHAGELYKFGDQYRCCPVENVQDNWSIFSYPFYREVIDRTSAFEELAAMHTLRPNLSVRRAGGTVDALVGEFVSGNYFSTLGVQPLAGRLFGPGDDRRGAPPVAVASYTAWQRYGFDRAAIGQPVAINGIAVTVVGVTPAAFFGDRLETHPPDFWLPLSTEPIFAGENSLLETTSAGWLYIVGRLRPGMQPGPVQAELTTLLRNYLRVPGHVNQIEDLKKIDAQVIRLAPAGGGINAMRGQYEQGLYLLLAVSAAVLLIACANLANLLLARRVADRVRTAVELAIGASRAQVIARSLIESLVLSVLGGAAGLVTATFASRAILLIAFRGAPHVPIDTAPSSAILLFTFGVSLVTGVLFGAGPAWIASRSDPADALRGSSRVVVDTGRAQRSLVILQAALSLVLVTVAGLLTVSLRNLDRQSLGFETEGRLVVEIDPANAGYTRPQLDTLYRRIDDRLARVPGVISESLSLYAPQDGSGVWGARIFLEGGKGPFPAAWDRIGTHYFESVGTPVLRGRALDEHDTDASRRVAVVNETFAARFFPNTDPTGHRFGKYNTAHANDYEIVGVVRDAKYVDAVAAPRPMFFVPIAQTVGYEGEIPNKIEESSRYLDAIVLHVHGDPGEIAPAVREALAEVAPDLPPTSVTSLPELIRVSTAERTLMARLSDAFGAIALLLAAIGLYGVTAYRVTRRRGEIGLRMALGASRRDIAALVLGGALAQTVIGLLIGIPLALMASRALQHQLFGVSPFSIPVLVAAVIVVCGCALGASVLPARRAAAVPPMDALRME